MSETKPPQATPPATEPLREEDLEPLRDVGLCKFCNLPIYDGLDAWEYGQPVVNGEPSLWHKTCGDNA